LSTAEWQERWMAKRLFLTADGEKDQLWGNLTIRWHPDEQWVEIALPQPLVHLANRPHGRYRLKYPVIFSSRGEEVGAQAATGAVRSDICSEPAKRRWYLDASWKCQAPSGAELDALRAQRVLAVDLNHDHVAAMVVDPWGNPIGRPITVPLDPAGLPATARDGHLRQAISRLIRTAKGHGCRAIVIEDLDFHDARELGREGTGNRPSRGKRGRSFRHQVAGLPTAQLRDRLVQMTANAGRWVIAVEAASTSRWGAEHSFPPGDLGRCLRPPRGGSGHRQTRTRTASTATEEV
jgi:hypothetical protein